MRKSDSVLLAEINYAILQMDMLEPNWRNQLYSKYYGDSILDLSVFSERERQFLQDFLSKDKVVRVTVRNAVFPYAYMDKNVPRGILLDVFAEVMRHTGLKYEFVMTYDETKPLVVLDGR